MLLDHIGFMFVPISTPIGLIMRIVGRLTAPVMSLFVAEGYKYTSSKIKYGLRLLLFAVISHFPYTFAHRISFFNTELNMIFTLFLSFLVLLVYDKTENSVLRFGLIVLIIALSYKFDWGLWAPMWTLAFYLFSGDKNKQAVAFTLISAVKIITSYYSYMSLKIGPAARLFQCGLLLFIPFIFLYNGEKGRGGKFSKWFFYIFYPAHLMILGIIYRLIHR